MFSYSETRASSVYQRVLGDDFGALDPQLRIYFGPTPPGLEGIGAGRFTAAGLRVRMLRPLFAMLARWRIAFPERGVDVPFTVRNVAAPDGTLRAERTFLFENGTRCMTDTVEAVDGHLIDRIGSRGQVEVTLTVRVVDGALHITSRRLALRALGARVPIPPLITVSLWERACEDGGQQVEVKISAPLVGEIYGYSGTFEYALRTPR